MGFLGNFTASIPSFANSTLDFNTQAGILSGGFIVCVSVTVVVVMLLFEMCSLNLPSLPSCRRCRHGGACCNDDYDEDEEVAKKKPQEVQRPLDLLGLEAGGDEENCAVLFCRWFFYRNCPCCCKDWRKRLRQEISETREALAEQEAEELKEKLKRKQLKQQSPQQEQHTPETAAAAMVAAEDAKKK